jgi:hypothetical protein
MLLNRRIVLVVAATAVVSCGSGSQETNQYLEIGNPCDVLADAGPRQAVYNPQALECPSRICLKPVNLNTAAVDTGPYCSATCSKDSDCDGQKKDMKDLNDHHCAKGYACGVAFVVGPLCCKKLCLCKDFLGDSLQTPLTCDPTKNNGQGCQE